MAGGSVTSSLLKSCFSCGEDPSEVPQGKFVHLILFHSNFNYERMNRIQIFCLLFVANKLKDGPSFLSLVLDCCIIYEYVRIYFCIIFFLAISGWCPIKRHCRKILISHVLTIQKWLLLRLVRVKD